MTLKKRNLHCESRPGTFSIRSVCLVSFQRPYFFQDFVSHFGKLLLDFLTVWSGIEAVVGIDITVSFVRPGNGCGFHRGVCQCRYEISEQNSPGKVFHHAMNFCKVRHKIASKVKMTNDSRQDSENRLLRF